MADVEAIDSREPQNDAKIEATRSVGVAGSTGTSAFRLESELSDAAPGGDCLRRGRAGTGRLAGGPRLGGPAIPRGSGSGAPGVRGASVRRGPGAPGPVGRAPTRRRRGRAPAGRLRADARASGRR